jgi:DNA-binding transcriptional ArsR family regulator
MPKRDEPEPSEGLVLAAVARACLHRSRESGVPFFEILDHLAIRKRTNASRDVRAHLDALREAGILRCSREHGVVVWSLTSAGDGRLERELHSADPPSLPESPQHRAWRNAHELAEQEIERFREELRATASGALELVDADPPVRSDVWFTLARDLRSAAWVVGSAIHCLHEWREPTDDRADVDNHQEPGEESLLEEERNARRARRAGRRNTTLWRDERRNRGHRRRS